MPDITRTFVKNLGPRRFLIYVPPNGRELASGQIVEIPGILETILFLSRSSEVLEAYRADIIGGDIQVTYDIEGIEGGGGGGEHAVPTRDDQFLVPLATANFNFQPTGILIGNTPASDSGVRVYVNGVQVTLSDGDRSKECYFSSDGGATGKVVENIVIGDALYFNSLVALYQLSLTDLVSLDYDVLAGVSSSSL
jgi:hypothetical protein